MRLAAQMKGGFYPAPEEAVEAALLAIKRSETPVAILDPCCGEGRALRRIAEARNGRPFGVELEPGRAARATEHLLPLGGQVLGPADFLGTTITPAGSFGMAWVNPPFDDEIGGGRRYEYTFLLRATQLLAPKGLMCFVCPEKTARNVDVVNHFFSWYQDMRSIPFPPGHRKYTEVVVFGVRRTHPVEASFGKANESVRMGVEPGMYRLPPAGGPKKFVKSRFTPGEMLVALASSPLQRLFQAPSPTPMARPPLELSKGQMALVLAGGYLNGVVQKKGERPILIKATPFKEDYMKSSETQVRNEGTEDEKEVQVTVMSERIKVMVRVAEEDGTLHDVK